MKKRKKMKLKNPKKKMIIKLIMKMMMKKIQKIKKQFQNMIKF